MNKLVKIFSCGVIISFYCTIVNADSNFLDSLKSYFINNKEEKSNNGSNNNVINGNITIDWANGLASIFKAVSPSVVSIFTVKEEIKNGVNLPNIFDDLFNDESWGFSFGFGRDGFNFNNKNQRPQKSINAGSGFCVKVQNNKLYIATNYHVIENAKQIAILFGNDKVNNNNMVNAKVHGTDPKNDLAVLEIDLDDIEKNTNIKRNQIQCIEWGNSSNSEIGNLVLAIGNTFGIGLSASNGIISAKNRNTDVSNNNSIIENCIQHTAAINYGNSGGVLVNTRGQVIGINTAIYSPNGGNVGVGFAIPSDSAKSIINELIDHRKFSKGWIGITIQALSYDEARNLGVLTNNSPIKPKSFGANISQVIVNSPADKAGIKPNDIVVAFNNTLIDENNPLHKLINDYEIGKIATLIVLRKNKQNNTLDQLEFKVTICDSDNYNYNSNNKINNSEEIEELGITVEDNGNQVVIVKGSAREISNGWWDWKPVQLFQEGDVITQINGTDVNNTKQLKDFVTDYYNRNPNDTVTLSITRQDGFNNKSFIRITTSKLRR